MINNNGTSERNITPGSVLCNANKNMLANPNCIDRHIHRVWWNFISGTIYQVCWNLISGTIHQVWWNFTIGTIWQMGPKNIYIKCGGTSSVETYIKLAELHQWNYTSSVVELHQWNLGSLYTDNLYLLTSGWSCEESVSVASLLCLWEKII